MQKTKFYILTCLMLVFYTGLFAQSPQKFNYQAVCRDNFGNVISNQPLTLRITIYNLFPGGDTLYIETHQMNTNNYGLVNLPVGAGTATAGNFANIPWGAGEKYMELEMDMGAGFNSAGAPQLISVPYALYANHAGTTSCNHYVGENFGGGIVFYLDATKCHGLIASTTDQSSGIEWSSIISQAAGAYSHDGSSNTMGIMLQGAVSGAAKMCDSLTLNGFDDWYLPSLDELSRMYMLRSIIGGFSSVPYWSSTEYSNTQSWFLNFNDGYTNNVPKSGTYCVRAIRRF